MGLSHSLHLGISQGFSVSFGLLLSLSLLLGGDALDVVLVSGLEGIHHVSEDDHDCDDDDCRQENQQVVSGRSVSLVGSQFEVCPPVEGLEQVEKQEHAHNLDPVFRGVLVDSRIIS